MFTKTKFNIAFLLVILSFILTGCWSVFGVEKSLVKGDAPNMLYIYLGIGVLIILFLVQVLLIGKQIAQKHIEETIMSAIIFTAFSFTIIGAFNAWLWGSLSHWNVVGIIICVLLSIGAGLKGLFPIMGFILYWFYKDENLLYYVALPNTLGYAILTVQLFLRAKSTAINSEAQ